MGVIFGGGSLGQGRAGCGGRIGAFFFSLIFLAFGLFFFILIGKAFLSGLDTYRWKSVPCRIESSQVTDSGGGGSRFGFSVAYAYSVGGRPYRSTAFRVGSSTSSDYASMQKLADRYRPGSQASCYVDPHDPSRSVLERSGLVWGLFLLLPLVFVVIGGAVLLGALGLRGANRGAGRPLSASARSRWKRSLGPVLLCLLVAAVGAVLSYFLLVRPVGNLLRAKAWTPTGCTILSSDVGTHRDSKGKATYSVDVLYGYSVGGRDYRSSRYDFIGGSSSGREGKEAIVRRFPKGGRATCFVDPRDPSEAVLERGFSSRYLVGLFPLAFLLGGGLGLVFSLRSALRTSGPSPLARAMGTSEAFPAPAFGVAPVELHAKASPLGKLFGMIFLACFWNGIVSVFVYQAVSELRRGHADLVLMLFLVPFVLVGLALVGGVVYQFLALFNPRLHLTLSPAAVPPGGWLDVDWRFTGLASRLSGFRLVLEGREEATVRSGKSSQTLKSRFAKVLAAEVPGGPGAASGRARIQVPAEAMHTFAANSCKVVWALKARGDIPRWPDVNEEFEVTVVPQLPGGGP